MRAADQHRGGCDLPDWALGVCGCSEPALELPVTSLPGSKIKLQLFYTLSHFKPVSFASRGLHINLNKFSPLLLNSVCSNTT